MSKNISVGIDIGTYIVKVVVAEERRGKSGMPNIIGTGYAESKGMRYGYILNIDDVQRSIRRATRMAEKAAGVVIERAFLSIGGVSLDGLHSSGSTVISRVDNEITDQDIEAVIEATESTLPQEEVVNKKILHHIPLTYHIDGKEVLGRPLGMKGRKLQLDAFFITCLEQHLHDLVQAVEDVGIDVQDVIAAPLAASIVTLTKAQKIAGCVLANIGSETVTILVLENNLPISLAVFPVGSNDITNDIALGLKVPLEEAEQIKRGGITGTHYNKKDYSGIIETRVKNIFELIESHLQKIEKNGMLPAGIIITGGGSGIATIEDIAKATLKLPSKIGKLNHTLEETPEVKDASWSVAYGLAVLGLQGSGKPKGISIIQNVQKNVVGWIKQLLP